MEALLQQFEDLKIQLEDVTSATNNFNDQNNCIGRGGFGKVYKGELSHSKGRSMVAIKRLDPKYGQGIPEFLKEITTLSDYKHENLISLLGFCYQRDEMILVYEHASRGSLDRYLNSPNLRWSQRLKICLDVAEGLRYLHDPRGAHQRLIHCDVKSANILLDDQWNAKVSDFGLSIMGPANEQNSVIVTGAAGTPGYYDPQYVMTHTLTKESDVYSFGVVLFEVLCGTLCCTYSNGCVQQILVPSWIESYKHKKLNDIIFRNPTIQPLEQSSLEIVSDIGYRCLNQSHEDRPKMAEIVAELKNALEGQELIESQEFIEWKAQLFYYEKIIESAKPPLNYRSEVELRKLLSRGVLLNDGRTWFSLNKKGEHCEMISIAECLGSEFKSHPVSAAYNSRFPRGTYGSFDGIFNTHVKTQFLSHGITYTINLVFKFRLIVGGRCQRLLLTYNLQGETESSISYMAYQREDGWWICELYQFTSDERTADLQIVFHGMNNSSFIEVEGIEFQPLEKQHISDSNSYSDANWEEKLPVDYEDKMNRSENSVQRITKEETYSIMCKGFLMKRGIWFSLEKNGKKCHMLSAALIWFCSLDGKFMVSPESRFGEAFHWNDYSMYIKTKIRSRLVSSETTYACYLVYKLPEDQSRFVVPMEVEDKQHDSGDILFIYLTNPQTPVIRPKAGQNTHNPLNRPKIEGLPQQRNDGWIEVQIWKSRAATTTIMELSLKTLDRKNYGLIIEGIEFRPI